MTVPDAVIAISVAAIVVLAIGLPLAMTSSAAEGARHAGPSPFCLMQGGSNGQGGVPEIRGSLWLPMVGVADRIRRRHMNLVSDARDASEPCSREREYRFSTGEPISIRLAWPPLADFKPRQS